MRLFAFFSTLCLFAGTAYGDQGGKKNICTITINSSHEKSVMQKYLPSSQFEFTELLPPTTKTGKYESDGEVDGVPEWLDQACKKQVECDVLVISGHFGGTFFGSSGVRLSLEQIERAACRPECAGIFKKPKEVFLFGCNTLAGKEQDHRTPEQYLQVLLADNIERSDAEQAVALRYSPWGDENLSRMQGVFSQTSKIHGFDSVGPSGANVQSMLEKYFKNQAPTYANYLEGLSKSSPSNKALKAALVQTSYVETRGSESSSTPAICYLHDKRVPRISKIKFIERSLTGKNPLLYAPAIANWVSQAFEKMNDENAVDEEWGLLDGLTWDKKTRDVFVSLASKIKNLPVLEAAIWRFAKDMRWITVQEFQDRIRRAVQPYFADKQITIHERDAVCSLVSTDDNFRVKLTRSELNVTNLSSEMVTALACLGNTDTDLVAAIENYISSNKKSDRESAGIAIFAMAEFSKFRGVNYAKVRRAALNEKDADLKVLLSALSGMADGGLDMEQFWNKKLEEWETIDFTKPEVAREWMYSIYMRSPTKLALQVLFNKLSAFKSLNSEDGSWIKVSYLLTPLSNVDPEEMADIITAYESDEAVLNILQGSRMFGDEEKLKDILKEIKTWEKVKKKTSSRRLLEIAIQRCDNAKALLDR